MIVAADFSIVCDMPQELVTRREGSTVRTLSDAVHDSSEIKSNTLR